MSTGQNTNAHGMRGARGWLAAAVLSALCLALFLERRGGPLPRESAPEVATVEVDQGDVSLVVTENGVLESSVDDVVRCRVESLLGLPVGAPPAGASPSPSPRAGRRIGGGSSATQPRETALAAVAKTLSTSKARLAAPSGTAPGRVSDSKLPGSNPAAGSSALAFSSPAATFDSTGSLSRSAIRSFDYVVEPHVPLRSTLPDLGVMATTAPAPLSIISILDEGTHVKAGEVVCELDSSALRDALTVQQLRTRKPKRGSSRRNMFSRPT